MGKKYMKISTGLVAILIVALIVGLGFVFTNGFKTFTIANGQNEEQQIKVSGDASALCSLAPSLSLSIVDAYNKGTSTTATKYYSVDGASFTSTAPSSYAIGSKVKVMAINSSFIGTTFDLGKLPCGALPVELALPAYTAPTLAIYDDAYNKLADHTSGAGVNATKTSSGGMTTLSVKFTGNNQKTSGVMVYVVELSTSANISESGVKMYDSNGAALPIVKVPTFYTNTLTSPRVVAFEVPAIVGASAKTYTLSLTASTGKIVQGAVYTTAYVEQAFIDTNGQAGFGVENADGTSKALANFDYDVVLA